MWPIPPAEERKDADVQSSAVCTTLCTFPWDALSGGFASTFACQYVWSNCQMCVNICSTMEMRKCTVFAHVKCALFKLVAFRRAAGFVQSHRRKGAHVEYDFAIVSF